MANWDNMTQADPNLLYWIWAVPSFLVVSILLAVFCIFCDRLSSRRSSCQSDSRRDTVPLDDLLSKPSLADPESVFSEAGSYEFPRPAPPHDRGLSGGSSGAYQEPLGDSSRSQEERERRTSHSVTIRQNNLTEAHSKGRNIHSWSQALPTHAPSSDRVPLLSHHQFRSSVEFRSQNDKIVHEISSTVKRNGSPRTLNHRELSQKIQLDSAGLKIHRDSITRDSLPFLSSTRCSFSHEAGHVVHGNKAPRPSLPKTEEADNAEANLPENDDRNIQSESTQLPLQEQTHERSESNYGTVNVNSNLLGTSVNNERQNVIQSSAPGLVNSVQNKNSYSNNDKQRKNNLVYISSGTKDEERNLNLRISTENQSAGVTMRRCFSCSRESGDSTFTAPSTPRKKTFSLNLKIDLHFDNDSGSREHLPTVVCSPVVEYGKGDLNASSDNIPCHFKVGSADTKKATNEVKAESEVETKQRLLERSFARKAGSTIDDLYLLARKRCSAPISNAQSFFEGVTNFRFGRRFSESEFVPVGSHFTKRSPNNLSHLGLNTAQSNLDERSNSVVRVGSTNISDTIMENHEEDNHCHTQTLKIGLISESESLGETEGADFVKKENNIFHKILDLDLRKDKLSANACIINSDNISSPFVVQNSNKTNEQTAARQHTILENGQKLAAVGFVSTSNNDQGVDSVPRSPEDTDYSICKTSISDSKLGLSSTPDNSNADLASTLVKGMDPDITLVQAVERTEASETLPDVVSDENEDKFESLSPSSHRRASTVRAKRTEATAAWQEVMNARMVRGVSLKEDSWTRRARNDQNSLTSASNQRNRRAVLFEDVNTGKEAIEAEISEENTNVNEKQNSNEHILSVQTKDAIREPQQSPPSASGTCSDSTVKAQPRDAMKHTNADSATDAETQTKTTKSVLKTADTKVALHKTTGDKEKAKAKLERNDNNVTTQQHNDKQESTSYIQEPDPSSDKDPGQTPAVTFHVEDFSSKNVGSDDSDYDNPWDDLDDAVMRASIRYNRRPSRVAAGDTKTLLLKSAEDLGRLLEEAEKRRQMRQAITSCQVIAASEPAVDSMTIPFTRYSPHRHTVKGLVTQTSSINTCHSTEDFLSTPRAAPPMLSLLRQEEAGNLDFRGVDPRRPMSLTTKMKPKAASPESKKRKK